MEGAIWGAKWRIAVIKLYNLVIDRSGQIAWGNEDYQERVSEE